MEEALLQGLVQEVRDGKRAESGFKESYMRVLPSVNLSCTSSHIGLTSSGAVITSYLIK